MGAQSKLVFEIRMFESTVGHAKYPRPGIVDRILPDGSALVYLLSTKLYSDLGQTFRISSTHPNFPATGLAVTSYTIYPAKQIKKEDFKSKRGELVGELAKEFQDWLA